MDELIYLIVAAFVIFYAYKIYDDNVGLSITGASFDSNEYKVQSKEDKKEATNILAKIRKNLNTLYSHLIVNFPQEQTTQNLKNNYNSFSNIMENNNSASTSYTLNKEKIVMCLRNKDDEFVKMNELMFVAIHEMAHIGTKSIQHTVEFWNNFKFILKEAEKLKLWYYVDYGDFPQDYCGIQINSLPN